MFLKGYRRHLGSINSLFYSVKAFIYEKIQLAQLAKSLIVDTSNYPALSQFQLGFLLFSFLKKALIFFLFYFKAAMMFKDLYLTFFIKAILCYLYIAYSLLNVGGNIKSIV